MDEGSQFLTKHTSELSCPLPVGSAVSTLCHILAAFVQFISTECDGFVPPSSDLQEESLIANEQASTSSFRGQTLAGIYIPTQVGKLSFKTHNPKPALSAKSSLPFLHRHPERLCELLGKLFVFAFTWAFGGCFESVEDEEGHDLGNSKEIVRGGTTARSKFDALVHAIFTKPDGVKVQLPVSADLIYCYYVDIQSCSFVQWKKIIPSSREIVTKAAMMQRGIQGLRSTSLSFIDSGSIAGGLYRASEVGFVPTVDTVRICFLTLLIQKAQHPVTLSGNLGVGKSCILTYLIKLLQSEDQKEAFLSSILGSKTHDKQSLPIETAQLVEEEKDYQNIVSSLHVSSHTTSSHLQSFIEKCLMRKSKNSLTAPQGKKVCSLHVYT